MSENLEKAERLEQNLQHLLSQKQVVQRELLELNSAISELENADDAWKLVGPIMVRVDPKKHKKELQERLKVVELRMASIEKQESVIRDKLNDLQKLILGDSNE